MSLTILHIEDHKLVAETVEEALEMEGWRVVTCVNSTVALSRLNSNAPYDLLITDNHLPGVNGLELVRHIRKLEHRAKIPIIMFTAGDCRDEAYEAGVDVFLKKPEDTYSLIDTIRRLLNQDT
jgi:two-component system, chemotaxis family, chemotaxis protein CheY